MSAPTLAGNSIYSTLQGDTLAGSWVIRGIGWAAPTTNTHRCKVTDATSNAVLFDASAGAANNSVFFPYPKKLYANGITITTLGSGTVTIYLA
jgi:hypothetical protein